MEVSCSTLRLSYTKRRYMKEMYTLCSQKDIVVRNSSCLKESNSHIMFMKCFRNLECLLTCN